MKDNHKDKEPAKNHVELMVQTPRGLWSITEPADVSIRPLYKISTKVQQVIDDARRVFGFVEQDSKYNLFHKNDSLEPQRTLASYHFENGTLLILSVQGGNANETVPTVLTVETVRSELPLLQAYASAAGLILDSSELDSKLKLSLQFLNKTGETFWVEFYLKDYPMYPPLVEFVSQDRKQRGLRALYPKGFHAMPCICMRYNRKAYGENAGPHGDWRLLDWRLPTGNGIGIDTLTLMVSDLKSKISASAGRLA